MSDIETIAIDGYQRKLACLPRTVTAAGDGSFKVLGDDIGTPKLLTDDELERVEAGSLDAMRRLIWRWINQKDQGSCAACMGVNAITLARANARLEEVQLSQAVIYGLGNGGRDEGMPVDSVMRILGETGTCPTDVVDQYDWVGYGRNRWPSGWRESAKRYKGVRFLDCPTIRHWRSATAQGHPVGFGYFEGRGGHAVTGIGKLGDELFSLGSWGKDYGDNGIHRHSMRLVEEGIKYFGAFAFVVATDPSDDGDVPAPS